MRKSLHTIVFLLLLLSGCATKMSITSSNTYLVSIKNKQIAFSDTGFLNYGKEYANLQILSAGTALFNLEVSQSVCLDGKCTDHLSFNKLFFNQEHYEGMIGELLMMKPIYDGQNCVITNDGFEQKIDLPNSHIIYTVHQKNLYFKDSKNGILMKLKELK